MQKINASNLTGDRNMKSRFWITSNALFLALALSAGPAIADDGQLLSMVNDLQKQMAQMQKVIHQQNQKIQDLERREPQVQATPSGEMPAATPMNDYDFNTMLDTATGGAQKWLKDLKQSGDLRLRYEAFHYGSGAPTETDDRNRFRYRLRWGLEKKFSDEMKAGFGLASGEGPTSSGATAGSAAVNSDPTSTNTTFDNNFNFKPIYIEKAYGTYNPKFLSKKGILDKTEISAGKMNNPFEKGSSDMVWDRDVKPEGIYEKFDWSLINSENLTLSAYTTFGQFVLDEDATAGSDANLFAYQMGFNPVVYTPFFERPVDILQAFSLYDYSNYARKSNFIIGGASLAGGNPNADSLTTELDAGKFKVIEYYSEIAVYPHGLPVRFHMDIAGNPAEEVDPTRSISESNIAAGFGVKLGGIVKKGDWELGYAFKRIGANSVVGAFNDSDFGDGHSGRVGSVIKGAYALTDVISLNGAMFFVDNLNAGTAGIIDQQQRRFQVDLSWKF